MSTPPKPASTVDGSRFAPLDGIRGIAIFGVLAFHYAWAGTPDGFVTKSLRHLSAVGWAGVDLFFVLSGFLITGQLLATRTARSYYKPFYARRALRIVPLYLVYLAALVAVVGPILAAHQPERAAEVATVKGNGLWYVTYTTNILVALRGWEATPLWTSHLWSLAIEEQFYLVWPFFVRGVSIARACALAIMLFLAATVARLFVLKTAHAPATAMYVLAPTRLDGLALGALLAAIVLTSRGRDLARRFAPIAGVGALVVLAVLAGTHPTMSIEDVVVELIGFPAFAVAGASLIAMSITHPMDSRLNRVLSFPPLRRLGFYSYGVYVLHYPTFWLFERAASSIAQLEPARATLLGNVAMFGLQLGGSIAVAMVSWFLLERNFLKLKRLFPLEPRVAPAADEVPSIAVASTN